MLAVRCARLVSAELKTIRDRSQKELDRLDAVWSKFKNLKVQDLEGDESLYRELRDRYGIYFQRINGSTSYSITA